ncbi:Galactose mutarotase [Faunimonas pinastri]|uniref:Galactose mutarotase n=1 Tax=Faunimonas pinastri TaxID=1855383 RepID=A0A1H9D856_9HYPH|nr:aldose 1-epimerase family protein [Faunimonas pinastri]SEQ09541.1 Galactose mutarotase [Faunimonas pinastri]
MRIASDQLSVEVSEQGAELRSVQTADGADWLWDGDPQWWRGRAPLLFPVVGKSPEDTVRIDGQSYPMGGHGFARSNTFEIAEQSEGRVVLRLRESEATREHYPFAFTLTVSYEVDGNRLANRVTVTNSDDRPLPFCFGFHPAFVWPLPGCEGEAHKLWLDHPGEPEIRMLREDGLIKTEFFPSPFNQGVLELEPSLFDADALILDHDAGSSVRFGVPGRPGLEVAYENCPNLGIWTKPGGAPFLCIEPWHGFSPFVGGSDEMEKRPGVIVLPPGEEATFSLTAAFGAPIPA